MRIYDPKVGRFLSVDPITKKYPFLKFNKDQNGNVSLNNFIQLDGFSFFEGFIQHIDIPNSLPIKFLDVKPSAGWNLLSAYTRRFGTRK
jgi:hypothetical protein